MIRIAVVLGALLAPMAVSAADFYIYVGGNYRSGSLDDIVDYEGAGAALGFGWDFKAPVALEVVLDGSKTDADISGFDVGELSTGDIALNLYYAPRLGWFQPRIGGGLGYQVLENEAGDKAEGGMAQINLGGMIWVGEHFAFGPTYRYRAAALETDFGDIDGRSHLIEVGAKVSF